MLNFPHTFILDDWVGVLHYYEKAKVSSKVNNGKI